MLKLIVHRNDDGFVTNVLLYYSSFDSKWMAKSSSWHGDIAYLQQLICNLE